MECRHKKQSTVATSAISINATITVFLTISMVYLFLRLTNQQLEIELFRNKLQNVNVVGNKEGFHPRQVIINPAIVAV